MINIDLTLLSTSEQAFNETIKTFDTYKKENRISKDLAFQQKMYDQQQERKNLIKEEENRQYWEHQKNEFLSYLNKFTFGCNIPEKTVFGKWNYKGVTLSFNTDFTYYFQNKEYESTFKLKNDNIICQEIFFNEEDSEIISLKVEVLDYDQYRLKTRLIEQHRNFLGSGKIFVFNKI